jgi:Zn-dependent protease with chaperone function
MERCAERNAVSSVTSKAASPERVSFFEEQARWRRRTWRASAVCGLAALVMGAPLAVLVTPIVVLLAGLVLKAVPGSESGLDALIRGIGSVSGSIGVAFDEENPWGFLHPRTLSALTVLLLPGMILLLGIWLALRARFRRAGVGPLLSNLGARPPRREDVEEIQIGNVVDEMAIASGCPRPPVFVIDASASNAAAIGVSENGAAMVVSRGFLDGFARDETQAVVGHLIGCVANGDLRILASLNAVFQSVGLVLLALDAAFALSPSAARDVVRTLRFMLGWRLDSVETAAVEDLLVSRVLVLRDDGLHGLTSDLRKPQPETRIGRLVKGFPPLYVVLVPFLLLYIVSLLLRWQVWLLRLLVAGPMVMMVWRTRRYLADAASVRLTRNPDALARALERLSVKGDLLSRARWAEPLFVVGSESAGARPPGSSSRGAWSEELGGVVGSHPPLRKRLRRVAAMGGLDLTDEAKFRGAPGELTLKTLLASPLLYTIALLFFVIAIISMALAAIPAIALTLFALKLVLMLL